MAEVGPDDEWTANFGVSGRVLSFLVRNSRPTFIVPGSG